MTSCVLFDVLSDVEYAAGKSFLRCTLAFCEERSTQGKLASKRIPSPMILRARR